MPQALLCQRINPSRRRPERSVGILKPLFLELKEVDIGIAHLFIQHTSASLTINENADPSVRTDMEHHFNQNTPENQSFYTHTYEGPDDITAHLKTTTIGNSLSIPIKNGQLALGIWQGIYLGEHRNHAGSRKLIVTLNGE